MDLKSRLLDDMKSAMRAKEAPRLSAIRLILAAIKQFEVDTRTEANDSQVLDILMKMLKKRKDSACIYEEAKRDDLAAKELAEVVLIESYLPPMMDDNAIQTAIDKAIQTIGLSGMANMGQLMARLKAELAQQADMAKVSKMLKNTLAKG